MTIRKKTYQIGGRKLTLYEFGPLSGKAAEGGEVRNSKAKKAKKSGCVLAQEEAIQLLRTGEIRVESGSYLKPLDKPDENRRFRLVQSYRRLERHRPSL